jgi:hypothetical protein
LRDRIEGNSDLVKKWRITPVQIVVLILAGLVTVAYVFWRRSFPIEGRWQGLVESYAVAIFWVVVLIASGVWRGKRGEGPTPITYFNSAWNPQAVNRAGFFLGWLAGSGLLCDKWSGDSLAREFLRREVTGAELLEDWGEKIVSDMLSDQGNAFALDYFASSDDYWDDCEEVLGLGEDEHEDGEDSWESFEALNERIDSRFAAWQSHFL